MSNTVFKLQDSNSNRTKNTNVRDVQQEAHAAEFVAEKEEKQALLKNTLNEIKARSLENESGNGSESRVALMNKKGFDSRLYMGSSKDSYPNMHNNLNRKTICLNMIVKNEAHVIA